MGMYAACLPQILVRTELWISIHTMLKDAATLSWLASVNGVVVSSSLGKGRTAIQTIVLPRVLKQL